MQTASLNGRIGLVGLLTTLLMLHALADDLIFTNSQYQKDDFDLSSSIPLGDPSAGPFGSLLGNDGPKIDSTWAADDAGLKLNSNPQDGNRESPLLAEASITCPNLSRLRQSRRDRRDLRGQISCKWPYSGTTTTTTPEAQEGTPSPGKQQPGKPWPQLRDRTSPPELWLQLYTARGVEAESNLQVCNRYGLFPVCYPYKIPGVQQLFNPAPLVEPCRFWSELDPCKLEVEELWCCHYAKERPVDDVLSTTISASSFSFNMRYHGAGVDCKMPNNPEVNNLGRGW